MQGLAIAVTLSLLGGAVGYSARGGAWAPSWAPTPRRPAPAVHMVETAALQLDTDAETVQDWSWWLQRPRYPELRDIALSISVRRTVDEAELAVKLANEYSDPSLLQDIDFDSIVQRLQADMAQSNQQLAASGLLPEEELESIAVRQRLAVENLESLRPPLAFDTPSSAVAEAVPKIRRVISRAREVPLAIELPASIQGEGGIDLSMAFNESKNLAEAVKQTWQRLNGASPEMEEQLIALQRESKALLSLRAEASKLRGGIKLVRRQKELKSAYLVRFGTSESLLEETLRADVAISKLQTELGLKSALLEMERIFLTLQSELSVTSSLVDQLLKAVQSYGEAEARLHGLVADVAAEAHERVSDASLLELERDISYLLLQLGLATQDAGQEAFSWARTRESLALSAKKTGEGIAFYSRGVKLMGEDVQLMVNMLSRAVVQGYTLRPREVKLLRRIGKDLFTLIPFVIILLIPLSPLGHVLVFSFIQRFFPDFYPSQFTESRQNIMSMYSSITAQPAVGAIETSAAVVSSTSPSDRAVADTDLASATTPRQVPDASRQDEPEAEE